MERQIVHSYYLCRTNSQYILIIDNQKVCMYYQRITSALTTVGNHNHHIHPKTVRKRLREIGLRARRPYIDFPLTHTCEPSGGSIFLPILRVPSVPPVNFQNLPPVKKIKYKKILTYILRSIFLEFPIWNFRAEEKRREIRMVKVNVIFNDIWLLICLTPLQVNWVMVIN